MIKFWSIVMNRHEASRRSKTLLCFVIFDCDPPTPRFIKKVAETPRPDFPLSVFGYKKFRKTEKLSKKTENNQRTINGN